jgi:murein DD-endopeptidase MepM/ murein hydrolase activator NlpD
MMFSQFSSRRCVLLKRAASVSVFGLAAFLAGCSAQGVSFDDLQTKRYAQHKAASSPVPSEPVYGYRDAGHTTTAATGSYEPATIRREKIAPVRVASLDSGYVGSSYAMQPVNGYETPKQPTPLHKRYAQSGPAYYTQPSYEDRSTGYDPEPRGSYSDYKPHPRKYRVKRHEPSYPAQREGYYIVVEGDTLYSLAKRFGITTAELAEPNGILGSTIFVGQKLKVPHPSGYTASHGYGRVRPAEEREEEEVENEEEEEPAGSEAFYSSDDRKSPAPYRRRSYSSFDDQRDGSAPHYSSRPRSGYKKHEGSYKKYTVRRGDTLHEIARQFGLSYRQLAAFNDIPAYGTLFPGQVLHIPAAHGGYEADEENAVEPEDYGDRTPRRYEPARSEEDVPYWKRSSTTRNSPGRPQRRVASAKLPERRGGPEQAERKVAEASIAEETERAAPQKAALEETSGGKDDEAEAGIARKHASDNDGKKPVLAAHSDVNAANAKPAKVQASSGECSDLLANPEPRAAQTFREPVQGLIVAKFGAKKDGQVNDGIDFSVPKGTPIKAAENGVVAYTGDELPGFGKLILVRHADGYVTAYANNDELLVSRCDVVKRGQVISKAGATGEATKPQLHFELRKDSKPVDPEGFFTRS